MTTKHIKKSFSIKIEPTHFQGNVNGYFASYGKYQAWSRTRVEVIKDILDVVYQEQNKRGYC
mgnify:CR=1 FL=1